MVPAKMVLEKMVFQKNFSTDKNVTVIFAFNYRRIEPRKNGHRKNGQSIKIKVVQISLLEKNSRMKNSWKNGPCQNCILEIFSTHRNVTVIFASKQKRIELWKNGPRKNGQSIKIKKSFKFPSWKKNLRMKNSWKNGLRKNGTLEIFFNS